MPDRAQRIARENESLCGGRRRLKPDVPKSKLYAQQNGALGSRLKDEIPCSENWFPCFLSKNSLF
jgi:hypothetical protein